MLQLDQQDMDIDVLENTNQSLIHSCPDDLVFEIFTHLNLDSLAKSCQVSKNWKQLASKPLSFQ